MRILFLSEGDAETHDSWSGVSRSVVMHLRALGHTVFTGDTDLYGVTRLRVAARTLSPSRKRWWVRYHLEEPGFRARSQRAQAHLEAAGRDLDAVLQVGATFRVRPPRGIPLALYCDSNIQLSQSGAASGHSEAAALSRVELSAIRAREETVYRGADVVFTMSEMLRRSFMRDFAVPADRLVTVHCAPNVPFPDLPEPESPSTNGPPTVLFVGRDFARKGGATLMEAFTEVRRRVPHARLRFVGCSEAAPDNCPPWVEFIGFQSRDRPEGALAMDAFYRDASVFCLPTRFEPFGTSFVEAMGYGLPCVGPRAWAVPEIIDEGVTGYLVPPGDVGAWADAIASLLENPARARRMGLAGRERALRDFTWPRIARRMSQELTALTGTSAIRRQVGDRP